MLGRSAYLMIARKPARFENTRTPRPDRRRPATRLFSASRNSSTRRSRCTSRSITPIALSSRHRALLPLVLAAETKRASGEGTNFAVDLWHPTDPGPKSPMDHDDRRPRTRGFILSPSGRARFPAAGTRRVLLHHFRPTPVEDRPAAAADPDRQGPRPRFLAGRA